MMKKNKSKQNKKSLDRSDSSKNSSIELTQSTQFSKIKLSNNANTDHFFEDLNAGNTGSTTSDEEFSSPLVRPKNKSILFDGQLYNNKRNKRKLRKDKFGSQIERGQKNHKISFKQDIEEVIEVENWKKHNKFDGDDASLCCQTCMIF